MQSSYSSTSSLAFELSSESQLQQFLDTTGIIALSLFCHSHTSVLVTPQSHLVPSHPSGSLLCVIMLPFISPQLSSLIFSYSPNKSQPCLSMLCD